jgi:hypothetical protein|tara:strand:+ start:215 stop:364 length:150 start_codon:yes stop_codon:yes gene_type:complete
VVVGAGVETPAIKFDVINIENIIEIANKFFHNIHINFFLLYNSCTDKLI